MDFGALKIDIITGYEKAKQELNNVADSVQQNQTKINKFGDTLKKGALAASAGVVTLGASMFGMATKSAEATDRIDKMSQKIGISKELFQEMDYVFNQSGASVDSLQVGMKTLVQQIGSAEDGSKKATQNFNKLGISWKDGTGKLKDQETMLKETINALAKMENGTEKSRIASELFGKAGVEMIPMLSGGAEAIQELTDKSHSLGLILSDEAVASGVKFTDTMDNLKRSFGTAISTIGVEFMPLIQKLADKIITNMPTIQAIATGTFTTFGNAIKFVTDNANWLIPVVGGLTAGITALKVIDTARTAMDLWKASTIAQTIASGSLNTVLSANPIGAVILAIGALVTAGIALYQNWDVVKEKAGLLHDSIKNIFSGIVGFAQSVVDKFWDIVNAVKEALSWVTSFWKKDAEGDFKKYDGSHFGGLERVPKNDYRAVLHKDEAVLTAEQAEQWRNNTNNNINISGNNFVIREEADMTKIARELQRQITTKQRGTATT